MEDETSITLHDLNAFSGLFGASTAKIIKSTEVIGIGVVKDRRKPSFMIATLDSYGQSRGHLEFTASQEGAKQWERFLNKSTSTGEKAIICAEVSFLGFLTKDDGILQKGKPPNLTSPLKEPENALFRPVTDGITYAYLRTIRFNEPSILEGASFLARVAYDPLTHYFLTLTGMAHSAQDILRYIKGGLPHDIVIGAFPGGFEMFILGRTGETAKDVKPADFGIEYFATISRNKDLLEPYRTKLALIAVCKKYRIRLGYQVCRSHEGTVEGTNHERYIRSD